MRDRSCTERWEQEGGARRAPTIQRVPMTPATPEHKGIEIEEADNRYRESGQRRDRRALDAALEGPAQSIAGAARTVRTDATLAEVVAALGERGVHALAVVDAAGALTGVISPAAVLRAIAGRSGAAPEPTARDLASAVRLLLRTRDPVRHVLAQGEVGGSDWCIPVVNEAGRPVALLAAADVLRYLVAELWPRGIAATLTPRPEALAREGG